MTEDEWLHSMDPIKMLGCLRDREDDRKFRLFAVACCRRVWPLLDSPASRKAVEVAESYADGAATDEELREVHEAAEADWKAVHAEMCKLWSANPTSAAYNKAGAAYRAAHAAATACERIRANLDEDEVRALAEVAAGTLTPEDIDYVDPDDGTLYFHCPTDTAAHAACAAAFATPSNTAFQFEYAAHSKLLRDIFGNPFRATGRHNYPKSERATELARAMYEERDFRFPRMRELADILEETSGAEAQLIGHCREAGTHVRGCWVVDLLLAEYQPAGPPEDNK